MKQWQDIAAVAFFDVLQAGTLLDDHSPRLIDQAGFVVAQAAIELLVVGDDRRCRDRCIAHLGKVADERFLHRAVGLVEIRADNVLVGKNPCR